METAIRWSPSSTTSEQRFLLADVNSRTIKICKVDYYNGKDFRYETLSTARKVPQFCAFDWSSKDEDVVAVGQWSGETTVLRIGDRPQALHLTIKHKRLCNAVAFNTAGLLATGLERIRNDFCLNIWNVSQRLLTSASPNAESDTSPGEPLRKLASSEAITSIKFFNSQPETLISGVKGACVRIYDLRDSIGNASLQFQTSCVHNIAIDSLDENYFASAGPPKDTTVQIWDRRWGPISTATHLGSSGMYQAQHCPILELKKAFDSLKNQVKPSIWSLRYCKGKRGCLGVLTSTGDFKIFETEREYTSNYEDSKDREGSAADRPLLYAQGIYVRRAHHIEYAYDDAERGRQEKKRIVSFDFTNLAGSSGRPCAITLRGDQNIEIYELKGPPPALTLSPIGGLVASKTVNGFSSAISPDAKVSPSSIVRAFSSHSDGKISDTLKDIRAKIVRAPKADQSQPVATLQDSSKKRLGNGDRELSLSSREAHERLHDTRETNLNLGLEDALSFFDITRRRCAEGYLFDCKKNAAIVTEDPWLQEMWLWIDRARGHTADGDMMTEILDLSYLGIFSIWNNELDPQEIDQRLSKAGPDSDMVRAVKTISGSLQLPQLALKETSFPAHRQLCLYTCGLSLTKEQLENRVRDLASQGHNTRAATLAIIHNQRKLAFEALRSGATSSVHKELLLALAGYARGTTNDDWDETLSEITKGLDDPYARAILALVRYGDWHNVLAETSLPLKERVGVALMYLNDQELTQYIKKTTAESIEEGDIEGIVLTGLTQKAVQLLQKYIVKFSDLQSAILAMSFTSPRYFSDSRVDVWRESYRTTLNIYRMFIPRVHFDVQSTKLSTPPNRKPLLPPAPRQVSLRCNNCDQSLDRNPDNAAPPSLTTSSSTNHQGSIFGDAKSGTVCPKCGRHMPRCVICMMWLGMPDPHTKGGATAGNKQNPMADFVTGMKFVQCQSVTVIVRKWMQVGGGEDLVNGG